MVGMFTTLLPLGWGSSKPLALSGQWGPGGNGTCASAILKPNLRVAKLLHCEESETRIALELTF